MRDQTGFTLLELLVTLIVFSILAVMAAPMVTSIKTETDLNNSAENLIATIQKAKSAAKKESRVITVNLDSSAASTATEYSWQASGDARLYKTPSNKAIFFNKEGRLQQSETSATPISKVTLGICDSNLNKYSRQIEINYMGVITDVERTNCA